MRRWGGRFSLEFVVFFLFSCAARHECCTDVGVEAVAPLRDRHELGIFQRTGTEFQAG